MYTHVCSRRMGFGRWIDMDPTFRSETKPKETRQTEEYHMNRVGRFALLCEFVSVAYFSTFSWYFAIDTMRL